MRLGGLGLKPILLAVVLQENMTAGLQSPGETRSERFTDPL